MKITVLIVEDNYTQRLALEDALQVRGFDARGATSIGNARSLAAELGDDLDVAVLDMLLEEYKDAGETQNMEVTGAKLGVEIRDAHDPPAPEFLITTAYPRVDYFRSALKLGVAAYLEKDVTEQSDTIRHVRALALRRRLNLHRMRGDDEMNTIAEASRDEAEVLCRFCHERFCGILQETLGAPFLLLLTTDSDAFVFAGETELAEVPMAIYPDLQSLVHAKTDADEPWVLRRADFKDQGEAPLSNVPEEFDGAAFISLGAGHDVRLSLGILQRQGKDPRIEDAVELAKVVTRHCRTVIIEHLMWLISKWKELVTRRKVALTVTSQLCLYFGEEQLTVLCEPTDLAEGEPEDPRIQRLKVLAEDFRNVGALLASLAGENGEGGEAVEKPVHIAMGELVQTAWTDLCGALEMDTGLLQSEGDCDVVAIRDDLYFAISRLLHWFVERVPEEPARKGPAIRVICEHTADGDRVILEDESRRLPKTLRERLFMPFAQVVPRPPDGLDPKRPAEHVPLYLTQMLLVMRNNGLLEDRTEDMAGDRGHRFVISFTAEKDR